MKTLEELRDAQNALQQQLDDLQDEYNEAYLAENYAVYLGQLYVDAIPSSDATSYFLPIKIISLDIKEKKVTLKGLYLTFRGTSEYYTICAIEYTFALEKIKDGFRVAPSLWDILPNTDLKVLLQNLQNKGE